MKLIYIWINKSQNGFINKKGVTLSSEYGICFDIHKKIIKIRYNDSYINIFDTNGCIADVNAIVGKNGTGKSTILKHIFDTELLPLNTENREEYRSFREKSNQENTMLQIFEDEKILYIYYNFKESLEVDSDISYELRHIEQETYSDMVENNIHRVSKIFLSNSSFLPINSSFSREYGKLSKIDLTLNNLMNLSNTYFDPIDSNSFAIKIENDESKYFMGMKLISSKNKDLMAFQSLLDILYFEKLYSENRISSFAAKISTDLEINIEVLDTKLSKLDSEENLKITRYNIEGIDRRYKDRKDFWSKCIRNLAGDRNDLIKKLKLNVICEIDFVIGFLDDTKISIDIDEILKTGLDELDKERFPDISMYYNDAINDIKLFDEILSSFEYTDNGLPKEDMAYKNEIRVSLDRNADKYHMLLKSLVGLIKKKSFIIKYLSITNLKFSSGERAYLNFFSWINLLPVFKEIDATKIGDLRENILILIDEIDLYCHPEWQQKFISYLIEELENQFPKNKIQVIFTTHSPIILSDIPASNITYTKVSNEDELVIFGRHNDETFAANIYKLFNDSFYLSENGTIGSFAQKKINEIISELKQKDNVSNENVQTELYKKIEIIGEPVIKNKLLSMLSKIMSKTLDEKELRKKPDLSVSENEITRIRDELVKLIETIDGKVGK